MEKDPYNFRWKKYYGMQTQNCMRKENKHAPLLKEHFPNKCILVFVNNIWWINHVIKVLQIF
jgi:hypothetical protein